MSAFLQKVWTQDQFLSWIEKQDRRYEFDGMQPVAMTGRTVNHGDVQRNLTVALATRLRGGSCRNDGPDNGVATVGKTIRYPDGLITCSRQEGTSLLISGVVVIFEVISPKSRRMDLVTKVCEYAAVDSIRRYVTIDSTSLVVLVMERQEPRTGWSTSILSDGDTVKIPEVGIEIPVTDIYEGLTSSEDEAHSA
jgi:Uma2 family endonuclease